MCSIAARIRANRLESGAQSCQTFTLRLEHFTGKHESLRLPGGCLAGQIDGLPLVSLGQGSSLILPHTLHLDTECTLQLEQFRALLPHEERGSHAISAVAP